MIEFLNSTDRAPWKVERSDFGLRASIGRRIGLRTLMEGPATLDAVFDCVNEAAGQWAFVVETSEHFLAAVDRSRSYPLFYAFGEKTVVSPSARAVRARLGLSRVMEESALDFALAGYVTGRNTLYEGLHQLQAGELLIVHKATRQAEVKEWYRYQPTCREQADESTLLKGLAQATDAVFARVVKDAGNRPILTPLSGGLDSTLVLCKLKELGARDVLAFSYGPKGNDEARLAKQTAEELGVPWTFIPSTKKAFHSYYYSDAGREYRAFCANLCVVPNMQEIATLTMMQRDDLLPRDAFIVNGQSGDYITGGHIQQTLLQPEAAVDDVTRAIMEKHFSLWTHLKTEDYLQTIETKLRSQLEEIGDMCAPAAYERWEWRERQSKYVVNQQRTYDFLGLSWSLPLWDKEYCDFWETVPPAMKAGQALYADYLQTYDYKGVFSKIDRTVSMWPGYSRAIVPLVRGASVFLGGAAARERLYKRAGRLSNYGPHFGVLSDRGYAKRSASMRNAASMYAELWIRENLSEYADWFPWRVL